jgi:hypothetical protein
VGLIEGIRREWVDQYWPIVKPWIAMALEEVGSLLTLPEIKKRLDSRNMQMWVAWAESQPRIVVISEVYDTAAGLTCALPVVGGSDLASCIDDLVVIEMWAREQGCVRLTGEGRVGWERALKPHGWRVQSVQVEKRWDNQRP